MTFHSILDSSSGSDEPAGLIFDSTYLILVSGLPWQITKTKIVDIFHDVKILNGPNGIHFKIDDNRNKLNQAYIQLESEHDYHKAQSYNNISIGSIQIESKFYSNSFQLQNENKN